MQIAQLAKGDDSTPPQEDFTTWLNDQTNATGSSINAAKFVFPASQAQTDLLETNSKKMQSNLEFLMHRYKQIKSDEIQIRAQQMQLFFGERFNSFMRGLETLHFHHLSPELVSIEQANFALDTLTVTLQEEGLNLVNPAVDSIFRAETSYIYLENGTLRILVHLPCYRDEGILTLVKHVPIPFPLVDDKTIIIKPLHNYLAIDHSGSLIKTMSADDFGLCKKVDDLISCPNQNIYEKRFEDSCLIALYQSNYKGIRKNCDISVELEEDFVTQLNSTTFLLHLIQKEKIERICRQPRSRGLSSFLPAIGTNLIRLSPGCRVISKSFTFEASEDVFGNPVEVQFKFIDMAKVLKGIPLELLNFSLPHPYLTDSSQRVDLNQLASRYYQAQQAYKTNWLTISGYSLAFIFSILALAWVIFNYIWSCNHKTQPAPQGQELQVLLVPQAPQ
jgi:hypothetical protein